VPASSGHLPPGSHAVAQLIEAGLEQAAAEWLGRTTLGGYRRVPGCQILPALGSRRIAKLTVEEFDAFYRDDNSTAIPAMTSWSWASVTGSRS
jgi:hypothetical protein